MKARMAQVYSAGRLAEMAREARERSFELVADLTDEQLMGPPLAIVNPLRWEIGHVAWFQERWTLRDKGRLPSLLPGADALYDSAAIAHDTRWNLRLPSREDTLWYMREVRDRLIDRLSGRDPSDEEVYFVLLSLFHEDMHDEAFTYTRQTMGYPEPPFAKRSTDGAGRMGPGGTLPGDVHVWGGAFTLGAAHDEPFVFDNEKWMHPVEVEGFAIARAAVTQEEFAACVEDGGYRRRELWCEEGWNWRESVKAEHPVYWKGSDGSGWLRRHFDQWVPLEPHRPVLHVNWYEADAYCRWAGRRLPSEAEWEMAASWDPESRRKRRFPWGDDAPTPDRAHLEWGGGGGTGCLDVGALPAGDSYFGCRQMIGNVWEWTRDDFAPYPGFVIDPYKEYSQPWFYTHKVLRGGCWTTRSRLIRNTWRNFYMPDRRDVWAGFRTCAL